MYPIWNNGLSVASLLLFSQSVILDTRLFFWDFSVKNLAIRRISSAPSIFPAAPGDATMWVPQTIAKLVYNSNYSNNSNN